MRLTMDRRFLFFPTPSEKERHIIDEDAYFESRRNDEYRRDMPFERRLAAVILHSTWSIIDIGIKKTPWGTDGERSIQFIILIGRETAVRGIRIYMEEGLETAPGWSEQWKYLTVTDLANGYENMHYQKNGEDVYEFNFAPCMEKLMHRHFPR